MNEPHHQGVMNYVECDLEAALTLPQWRRIRAAAEPRRRNPVKRLITVGFALSAIV